MDWYYDKQVEIITESEGYLDSGGIWHDGELTVLKTIDCDVQPYNKERAYQDYGFTVDCTKRVFCDPDSNLLVGGIVEYNTELYIIVKLIDWDDYYDIILKNNVDKRHTEHRRTADGLHPRYTQQ